MADMTTIRQGALQCMLLAIFGCLSTTVKGQAEPEGVVQCMPSFQPVAGTTRYSGWEAPTNPCYTIEGDDPSRNISQGDVSSDVGDFLLFTGDKTDCNFRSQPAHLADNQQTCTLKVTTRIWGSTSASTLTLDLRPNPIVSNTDSVNRVWSTSSNGQSTSSSKWTTHTRNISAPDLVLFQMEFDARSGSLGDSGVALSGLSWTDCCLTECTYDVAFDNGWAGWYNGDRNISKSALRWQWKTGPTPSRGTGPLRDFSSLDGKGHYLFMEASSGQPGEQALLLSPVYVHKAKGVLPCQVSFSYHMSGADSGRLTVGVRTNLDWQRTVSLRNITAVADGWRLSGVIPMPSQADQFRIVFTGVRGNGFQGDIAIDSVLLDEWCSCPLPQGPAQGFNPTSSTTSDDSSSNSSTASSTTGYTVGVILLCILCAVSIGLLVYRELVRKPSKQPQPQQEHENPVFVATQKRLSLLGFPVENEPPHRSFSRKSSSASWQVKLTTDIPDEDADKETTATNNIEITPSLLDLMEMESSEGGILDGHH